MRRQSLGEPRPEYGTLANEPAAQGQRASPGYGGETRPSPLAQLVPSRNQLHGTVDGLRARDPGTVDPRCFVGHKAIGKPRSFTDGLAEFERDLIGTASMG
jgi:hypothetical protein